jgi:hypothetical protein
MLRLTVDALQPSQVVEIIAKKDGSDSKYSYGSGYRVATDLILTANHVIQDASEIIARFSFESGTPTTVRAKVVWTPEGKFTDVALIQILQYQNLPSPVLPGFGILTSEPLTTVPFESVGFPLANAQPLSPTISLRDGKYLIGKIRPPSNPKSGYLEIIPDGGVGQQPALWKGFSGASVFVHGILVGVVISASESGLKAIRISMLLGAKGPYTPEFQEPEDSSATFRSMLVQAGVDVALVPARRRPTYADYLASVVNETVSFRGRDVELAHLNVFSRSVDDYQWWVAGPWSGKTTLAAYFAAHPPDQVDIVTFFVSRVRSQQTRQFFDSVCDQLAAILGRTPSASPGYAEFISLWAEAGRLTQKLERHLVLLVDGLDENDDPSPIAAHLPTQNHSQSHVLVFSREGPPLSPKIAPGHPLRSLQATEQIRYLAPSPYAERLRELAYHEIHDLLLSSSERIVLEILCLLCAASPLTVIEIADILNFTADRSVIHSRQSIDNVISIERVIEVRAGRILRPIPTAGGTAYAYAHDELRDVSTLKLGNAMVAHYKDKMHAWAEQYEHLGWPDPTPNFLITFYPTLLTAARDYARLIKLPSPARLELLNKKTGHDGFGVQEIDFALDVLASKANPDIAVACALAIRRQELIDRTAQYPAAVAVAWASMKHWHRALHITQTINDSQERIAALKGLTELARRENPDRPILEDLLQEIRKTSDSVNHEEVDDCWIVLSQLAAELGDANRAISISRRIDDTHQHAVSLYRIAAALQRSTRDIKTAIAALNMAYELGSKSANISVDRVEALMAIAQGLAIEEPARSETLFLQAAEVARDTAPDIRDLLLNGIARSAADARVYERAVDVAREIRDVDLKLNIVLVLNRKEQFTAALSLVDSIDDFDFYTRAMANIALSAIQAGESESGHQFFAKLKDALESLRDIDAKARAAAYIGGLASEGDEPRLADQFFEIAQNAVREAESVEYRSALQRQVAVEFALGGDYVHAEEAADGIVYSGELVKALGLIGRSASEDGRRALGQRLFSKALHVASKWRLKDVDTPVLRNTIVDDAVVGLIRECILANDLKVAFEASQHILETDLRASILYRLSSIAARLGEEELSRKFKEEFDLTKGSLNDHYFDTDVSDVSDDDWWHYPNLDSLISYPQELSSALDSLLTSDQITYRPWSADYYALTKLLARIVKESASAGDFDFAHAVSEHITDVDTRASSLNEAAGHAAKAGRFAVAFHFLEEMEFVYELVDTSATLALVAQASAKSELGERAENLLVLAQERLLAGSPRTIPNLGNQSAATSGEALSIKAVSAVLANTLVRGACSDTALPKVGSKSPDAHEFLDQAEWLSDVIQNDDSLDAALVKVAKRAAALGDLDTAETIGARIVSPESLGDLLIEIAEAAAILEDSDRVDRIAAWLTEFDDRSEAVIRLVSVLACSGDLVAVEGVLRGINNSEQRVYASACTGIAMSARENNILAEKYFSDAESIIGTITDPQRRVKATCLLIRSTAWVREDLAHSILVRGLRDHTDPRYVECALEFNGVRESLQSIIADSSYSFPQSG